MMEKYKNKFTQDYPKIYKYSKTIDWEEVQPWNRGNIYYTAMRYYETVNDYEMIEWSYEQLEKDRDESFEPEDDVNYFDGGDKYLNIY